MKAYALAAELNGVLEGNDVELLACAGLEEARPGDLSFCKDPKHVKLVETTKASAVLLPVDWAHATPPCAVIRVADPNHACMQAAARFAPPAPVRAPDRPHRENNERRNEQQEKRVERRHSRLPSW